MTDYQKTKILALRQGGANASQIAVKVGVPRTTIQSFLSRAHIELDKENRRCKRCGEAFTVIPGHRPREFCSDNCRIQYWRKHRHLLEVRG